MVVRFRASAKNTGASSLFCVADLLAKCGFVTFRECGGDGRGLTTNE